MQLDQVTHPESPKLRDYLHNPEFDLLIEVLENRAFLSLMESATALEQWQDGQHPQYKDMALTSAKKVHQIRITIALLNELRNQKEPFVKLTATPNEK